MEGLPSGTVLGAVTAKDPDEGENGTVYYSLSGECFIYLKNLHLQLRNHAVANCVFVKSNNFN